MISSKFNSIKKEYLKTEPTSYLKSSGWEDLYQKLGQQTHHRFNWFMPVSLAFCLLLMFSTAVVASMGSKPGDTLYSVKIFSDDTYSKVTGNFDPAIDNRVEDIIELQDEPNGKFDQAAKQYQQTIEDAKEENEDSREEEKQKLREKLEEQEKKFEELSRQNPKISRRIQQILEETRRTRGEVKGDNDRSKNVEKENVNEKDSQRESEDRD